MARHLTAELTLPVAPEITAFVRRLVGAARPLAVLFYGSALRGGASGADALDGVLDFYVVLDRQSDWPRGVWSRLANAVLPPNVEYHAFVVDGREVRAKVALLTQAQLRARTRWASRDTTLWARFCQPVRLVWVRDAGAADAVLGCIARAIGTATRWAAVLGPSQGTPDDFWTALFAETYATELRVEGRNRPAILLDGQQRRYGVMLRDGWLAGGVGVTQRGETWAPTVSIEARRAGLERWRTCRALGRPLNIARLVKAAFTFRGGAAYLLWKIARHTGVRVSPSRFEGRHPLLGAPTLLWRLWRRGAFRRA
ncbi:hypothetical protein KGY14_14840 [Ameyamaea chiangmaiensis]|uniref:Uncharacterized protein n=1 Tax=Ameyamaea chiangmaiensis TaxID=442969 RepID=A0A850PET3_9PROT|nr:hypothetical protein [Ameyamaea chiangmaiensis]NVN40970.1 hypothetical protein [Ameyamaea chiangmaiensis]